MKFEKARNGRRTAIFEVDRTTQFHEQVVAKDALGVLTAASRKNQRNRLASARLGVRINTLESTRKDGEKSIPIPSSMPLTKEQAGLLCAALLEFITDTPYALPALLPFNVHACNVRVVEADIAQGMLDSITQEFGIQQIGAESTPYGFS